MPHEAGDVRIARFLQEHGYHPRSSAHGDALCEFVVDDLLTLCPAFKAAANSGRIVYDLNFNVGEGERMSWNVDLVVGPPAPTKAEPAVGPRGIRRGKPTEVWLAVDAKSVMTEHGKARRNRQRDLDSLQDILRRRDPRTIVGGLMIVNMAPRFRSPLRGAVTTHRNVERLVSETVQMYADLPRRERPDQQGLDALGVIVLSYTNVPGEEATVITGDPGPSGDSPVNYLRFIEDLCKAFASRRAPS